jgi:hypothetical protein
MVPRARHATGLSPTDRELTISASRAGRTLGMSRNAAYTTEDGRLQLLIARHHRPP